MSSLVRLRNIKRALVAEPSDVVTYLIAGRVANCRPYKSINFIDLVDGSTSEHLQLIAARDILKRPELGSYIVCRGNLVSSRGTKQSKEFKVERLEYMGKCDPDYYPLATTAFDQLPTDTIRNRWTHLRPREPKFGALLRLRSEMELSLHMIMKQMDFFKVHTPTLTANDSEASSDLFLVHRTKLDNRSKSSGVGDNKEDEEEGKVGGSARSSSSDGDQLAAGRIVREGYFGRDTFLVTSAQLHLESLASALSRVYCLSPTFRAENSVTRRHLCEFMMFEAEEANVYELEPLMNRVESIIKFVAQFLFEVCEHKQDFSRILDTNSNIEIYQKLASKDYIRMDYSEALGILSDKVGFTEASTSFGCDIGREHEKALLSYCDNVPIFITNYPKGLKPFYMKSDNSRALCFDLIAPFGGEICGGSLREDSLDKLEANLRGQLADCRWDSASRFDWYLDLRRFGSFPHGGFGIGFERLIQSLFGIRNIKDTLAFPRWAGHCPA